jgi:hypothetical protein
MLGRARSLPTPPESEIDTREALSDTLGVAVGEADGSDSLCAEICSSSFYCPSSLTRPPSNDEAGYASVLHERNVYSGGANQAVAICRR